jgi:tetratricopeptide (TPR) repeat protein
MSEKMTCSVCGYPNNDIAEICENCGASMSNGASEVVEPEAEQKNEAKKTSASPPVVQKKPTAAKTKNKGGQKSTPSTVAQNRRPMQSEFLVRDGMMRIQMKTWQFFGFSLLGFAIIVLVILYLVDSGTPGSAPVQTMPQQQMPTGPSISEIEKAQEQVAANPNNPNAVLALSHLLHDSNMFDQAVSNYRRYLEMVPDNPDARVDLGICLHALGEDEAAITEMRTAVDNNPKHQLGHFNLGIVSLSIGDSSAAKAWLQRTVELDAANPIGQRAATLITEISSDAVQ